MHCSFKGAVETLCLSPPTLLISLSPPLLVQPAPASSHEQTLGRRTRCRPCLEIVGLRASNGPLVLDSFLTSGPCFEHHGHTMQLPLRVSGKPGPLYSSSSYLEIDEPEPRQLAQATGGLGGQTTDPGLP